MTFVSHINATRDLAAMAAEDKMGGAGPSYVAPGSINDALLSELLRHGDKVPPTAALPELPPARASFAADTSEGGVAVPSMGASMMEAIVGLASLMRRQNAELRAQEVVAMAAQMESQADDLKEKASQIKFYGILAGALNITAGIASIGMGAKVSTKLGDALESEFSALNQQLGAFTTGIKSSLEGASTMTQAFGQSANTLQDEAIKRSEATVERTRARMEYMKSLEDSMREVISKAIATQDAIQQNTNQARAKILG